MKCQLVRMTIAFAALSFDIAQAQTVEPGSTGNGATACTDPRLLLAQVRPKIRPGLALMPVSGKLNTSAIPFSIAPKAGGPLFSVAHDTTLDGDGTTGLPLGVAVPFSLSGSVGGGGVISVSNSAIGSGLSAKGADSDGPIAGIGVFAKGGNAGQGGDGVLAKGGQGQDAEGGTGVRGEGGATNSTGGFAGGIGVLGFGGHAEFTVGGAGLRGEGGNSVNSVGGVGVVAFGGDSTSSFGGVGLSAKGGTGPAGDGLAGFFRGNVSVTGNLSKGGGSFKIDHPLDPENRYLYHSFVESPDMKNIYDGNIVTDENGEAVVELPAYFETLNRDFRYQLTVIGTFAQAIVAEKIQGNRFKIKTSAPAIEVSWQVTGIRHDAWANKNRIPVEEDKPERERGHYLHPEAFDQREERGVTSKGQCGRAESH